MQTQYNVFDYRIDFIFMTFTLQQKLMKMDTVTKVLTTALGLSFLEVILTKKILIFLELSMKNQLKSQLKNL